jgi:hypothetical protein
MIFQCRDRDGVLIACTRQCWENHILAKHPEMGGCEAHVKAAIEDPYQVYQDANDISHRVIYKPFILPPPFHTQYLRVAIVYKNRVFRGLKGYVLSAFPCFNIKKGDILIWTAL